MNCSHKYHKVKAHPETGIFLYKSVRWKKIEESDYLKKIPGIVIEPDIFLIVPCLDIAIYVYLCYRKVSSEKKLSTSIYDLVLIYVCHFHHHFLLLLLLQLPLVKF